MTSKSCLRSKSRVCFVDVENAELRKRLNRPEYRVVVGDRVIQTKNDRERNIFNGELGLVARADDEGFDVLFGDRRVVFNKQHFANRVEGPTKHLNWANAITVHKAQGSEFSVVIVPVSSAVSIMLTRSLYYTAVLRGQKKVIMVGDPAALKWASHNLRGKQRISKLAEFLNPERDWKAFANEERRIDCTEFDAIDPEALSRHGH